MPLQGYAADLIRALERIRDHQVRADRRKRGMVDADEVETLQRIARMALEKFNGENAGGN